MFSRIPRIHKSIVGIPNYCYLVDIYVRLFVFATQAIHCGRGLFSRGFIVLLSVVLTLVHSLDIDSNTVIAVFHRSESFYPPLV